LDKALGTFRTFMALDLKRAAQKRRRAAAHSRNSPTRAAAIQAARTYLAQARDYRLRCEQVLPRAE
jgi:hypothetical protein